MGDRMGVGEEEVEAPMCSRVNGRQVDPEDGSPPAQED